jgi:hypothetical protein
MVPPAVNSVPYAAWFKYAACLNSGKYKGPTVPF